jgi:hypothetical protein
MGTRLRRPTHLGINLPFEAVVLYPAISSYVARRPELDTIFDFSDITILSSARLTPGLSDDGA